MKNLETINEKIIAEYKRRGFTIFSANECMRKTANCVMHCLADRGGISDTIEYKICQYVGFITEKGNTTKLGRWFAHDYYVLNWRYE